MVSRFRNGSRLGPGIFLLFLLPHLLWAEGELPITNAGVHYRKAAAILLEAASKASTKDFDAMGLLKRSGSELFTFPIDGNAEKFLLSKPVGDAFAEVRAGARCRLCDLHPGRKWMFTDQKLPLGDFIYLARALSIFSRMQSEKGKPDEAILSAQLCFRLGEHLAKDEQVKSLYFGLLIQKLIAIPILKKLLEKKVPIEPRAKAFPYFKGLPDPLIDIKPHLDHELNMWKSLPSAVSSDVSFLVSLGLVSVPKEPEAIDCRNFSAQLTASFELLFMDDPKIRDLPDKEILERIKQEGNLDNPTACPAGGHYELVRGTDSSPGLWKCSIHEYRDSPDLQKRQDEKEIVLLKEFVTTPQFAEWAREAYETIEQGISIAPGSPAMDDWLNKLADSKNPFLTQALPNLKKLHEDLGFVRKEVTALLPLLSSD